KTEAETVQIASTATETKETTTGESSVSSSLNKDRSDSESNENSAESDGGDDGDSKSELPVWLVNDFYNGGYCSPDSDSYTDEEAERKARLYRRNLHLSHGFLVEEGTGPKRCPSTGIDVIYLESLDDEHSPVKGMTELQYAQDMAKLSLREYNDSNETNVKFDHVVRVTRSNSSWTTSYITFMAKESDDTLVEYQAKVANKSTHKTTYPIYCRPSPKIEF
ncbi:hypothetical protein CARUB_v10003895mg, partial [Capsella rubella]